MFCMAPEEYENVLGDLESEVEKTEKEFDSIKDSGLKKDQREQAESLIEEIHGQIEFLEEQLQRIEEKD